MLIADWLVALALFVASLNPQPGPELAPPPPPCVFEEAQLTEEQVRAVLACAEWPAELVEDALVIARCESSWSPAAHREGSDVWGLFQLWQDMQPDGWGWLSYSGIDPAAWADPVANARATLAVIRYQHDRGRPTWGQFECQP